MRTVLLAALVAAASTEPSGAVKVRDRALAGESASWELLTSLTTEIGPRPCGSPAMERARDWAIARLTKLGFSNVHVETFTKKEMWQRGNESASISAPYAQPLHVLALGNSAAGSVEAEIAVFTSLEALARVPDGSLHGKIVVVNQPMTRTQSGEGYGSAVQARGRGPGLAEQKGAAAYLTRSIATGDSRAPHTGATRRGVKIPSAALGVADADLLERLASKGPVRVKLDLHSSVVAETPAYNIVGEVRGRDPKAGVVVIGGHLDSWDPGQGAQDDGAGVAISMAAAKLIADLPLHQRPKRTVRVVLFGSEETGGSGEAYALAHKDEVASMQACLESDLGSGRVFRVAFPKDAAADPALAGLQTALAPLRVFVANDPARYAGSDMDELEEAGVPIVEVDHDATHYFDVHHSEDDTLDKVDRADLEQATAAWAALVYTLAASDVDLRHPPAPPK